MKERTKYIVLVGDGMADYPLESLGGKTPLQIARIPNMDRLAKKGELGLARSIPDGFPPSSDVANLSILGYNPADWYTGRSPLEAASMGVELGESDIAFRCNLVTYGGRDSPTMDDYSAGHITTEEAGLLIEALQKRLGSDEFAFYPGVSYRHLLVWSGGSDRLDLTPPHDI